jgi:chromosome segregation ATPase
VDRGQTIASLTEARDIALKQANESQAKVQLELDQVNATLNQCQIDHKSSLNSLNEERDQLQTLKKTLEDQVHAAQAEISALQCQLRQHSTDLESMQQQVSSFSAQVSALQSQCSELQTTLTTVSADKNALESKIEVLESARSQSASASEHELSIARQELTEARNETGAAKTALLAAQSELESLLSKVRTLEEQLAEVSSELEQSRLQHRSVQAELLTARSAAEQVQNAPASVAPSDQDALDGEAVRSLRAQLEVSRLQATKAQEMAGIAQADLAAALVKHAAEAAAAESKISLLYVIFMLYQCEILF